MRSISVLVILLALNCVSANAVSAPDAVPVFSENKLAFMVRQTQPTFVIRLKSNPTTGFSWFLREFNSNYIEPVSHQYEMAKNKSLMGAPGYEVWTFRVKPGAFVVPVQTTIRLVYSRPWEAEDAGTQLVYRVSIL